MMAVKQNPYLWSESVWIAERCFLAVPTRNFVTIPVARTITIDGIAEKAVTFAR